MQTWATSDARSRCWSSAGNRKLGVNDLLDLRLMPRLGLVNSMVAPCVRSAVPGELAIGRSCWSRFQIIELSDRVGTSHVPVSTSVYMYVSNARLRYELPSTMR